MKVWAIFPPNSVGEQNISVTPFIESLLERYCDCGHLEPNNEFVRSFSKEIWTKEDINMHKIVHSRPSNHENSSTLEVDCGKSISLIVLKFLVALDIGLLHSKHILYYIYHQNSKNAAKPRNQCFRYKKCEKMA